MKGKNIVLTVAVVAACAGTAMAAPKAVKSNMVPTRLVPTAICPIYIVDGVEVQGEFVPYVDRTVGPALANRQIVWDAYDADENDAAGFPPIDRGGPCGGAGFLYTANTDSSSSDFFHVRVVHAADDFKGVDPAAQGQFVAGLSFLWNHVDATENVYHVFFLRDGFNETNSPTFGVAGGRGRVQSGATFVGLGVTYGGAIGAGYYYVDIDWIDTVPAISPTAMDTGLDGSMSVRMFRNGNTSAATDFSFKDQISTWGTRADELPAPQSTPRPGAQGNPFMYIDDAGALGSAPYVLANAVSNGAITPAGADGGPNETYTTGPSTDPADCFRTTGLCWAFWIKSCQAQDAATLVSPADGATGVTNNAPGPSFEWAPGAIISPDYSCKIYQNNVLVHTMNGILTTTFDLDIALAAGCYEWSMVSNAGGLCPGTESARNEFAMVGSDCNSCTADFNGDTVVDFFDYLDFVDAFSANAPSADFNGDTVIDFFDYLDFVDAFSTGCP